jgi:hypothetical protein
MCIAWSELGPSIANTNYWLVSLEEVMGKSLVFHPGAIDESVFSGASVPLLAAKFLFGHGFDACLLKPEFTKKNRKPII